MLRKAHSRRTKALSVSPVSEPLELRRLFAGLSFTEFPQIGMGTNFVQNLTAGADGNVYFSSGLANNVASITPAGVVTVYDTTSVGSNAPNGVAAGPGGNIYFDASNNFGELALPAGTVSNIPLSKALNSAELFTLGPDGNFYADCFPSVIEQITPTGKVTDFNYSGSGSGKIISYNGQLYFASGTDIRSMTTSGTFNAFPTPSGGDVEGLAVGPDGNLWFTEQLTSGSTVSNFYGYLTKNGAFMEFPSTVGPVNGIAAGSDGNMYFRAADYLVGVNLAGTVFVTQDLGGGNNTDGKELIAGPDGNLWYNESFGDRIGTVFINGTTPTPTPTSPTPTPTSPTPTPTSPTPTSVDTTPPQAVLASAPAYTAGTAMNYYFNVDYTDNVAIDRASIGNSNVTVTGPSGPIPVTLGAITVMDDADMTATYRIAGPAFSGTYQIYIVGDSVTDTSGNPVAPETLGSFNVIGPSPTPTPTPAPTPTPTSQPVLVTSLPGALGPSVIEGSRGAISLQVTNSGTAVENGPVTVALFISPTPSLGENAYVLTPSKAHRVKLGIGATKLLPFHFRYPISVPQGNYYILAEVSSASAPGTVTSTAGSVLLANPFIDLAAGFAIHPSVTFADNGHGTAYVDVTNKGNTTAHGVFQVDLAAVPIDGSANVPLPSYKRMTKLYPGQEKLFTIHFRFPPTLLDGTYRFQATVDPGDIFADTNLANNTAIDPVAFIYG